MYLPDLLLKFQTERKLYKKESWSIRKEEKAEENKKKTDTYSELFFIFTPNVYWDKFHIRVQDRGVGITNKKPEGSLMAQVGTPKERVKKIEEESRRTDSAVLKKLARV